MKLHTNGLGLIMLFAGAVALAQQPPAPPQQAQPAQPPQGMGRGMGMGRGYGAPSPQPGRGPMERGMGRWWKNPEMVEKLGVTLMNQAREIERLRTDFSLGEEDLNLDLGPLGKLL